MKKLLVVLAFVPTLAQAEFLTGNDLLSRLQGSTYMEKGAGLGYIQGVFDATQHWGHCTPNDSGITAGQIRDMVEQSLIANPATRNLSADFLILNLLKSRWPCANQNKRRGA
jgi:hypothetical protein